MKKLCLATFLLLIAGASGAAAQSCPAGFICLTQAAANVAFANAKEVEASRAEITVLKQALLDKDKNTAEIKAAADKAIADLKEALHKTEVQLALKTGELINADSERTRLIAMLEMALKNTKKKRNAFITIF